MTDPVRILLVEDSDADARYVKELFREPASSRGELFPGLDGADDVEIRRESDLGAAVGALEDDSAAVDVVLLDLHLPGSQGLETLETVLETTRQVPVVVLTGVDDAAVGAEAVRAGAQDFLVKDDVTRDLLERAIQYAIQRHETAAALRERTEQLEIMNQLTRHDVRNDISLVVGRAEQLRSAVDDRHADALEEIVTASNHVLQLTRSIGAAVEAVSERQDSTLGPVDLSRVLESEVRTARRRYQRASIEIHGDCSGIEVRADGLLSSVFGNVLSNAVVYSDEQHPTVDVGVTVTDDTVAVAFADNGPGIPVRKRRELFARESSDLDGSGLGIGLYLVRRLVDRYGGAIDIADNDPKGTVFTIELQRVS